MSEAEVLLISSYCSADKYRWITSIRTSPSLDPAQRMFKAVTEGLRMNGCNVTCISALPMGTSNSDSAHRSFSRSEEIENGIRFIYPAFEVGKIKRMLDLHNNTADEVNRWLEETAGKGRYVICDSLLVMCTGKARKLAQKNGVKTFAYVTDYPSLATSIKRRKTNFPKRIMQYLYDGYADRDLKKYDGYVLVAEALKDLIGFGQKPYIVIEDIISVPDSVEERHKEANSPFTIVYGGALCERFGVNKLADAVKAIPEADINMCFYGSGESVDYINMINKTDTRIRYCGQVPFDELQVIQRNADLLVNPRPSDEAFAAYSFPSKTLSYMLTGTPVLTTRIPGIPSSYQPYLLWFDAEDTESMTEKILEIAARSEKELRDIGAKALTFAKNEKNSIAQTARLLAFMEPEKNGR